MDSNWVSIIGTLGGVVIGTAGTIIVQRLGKLRVNIKSATLSFSGPKPVFESFGKLSSTTRPETGWFNLEVLIHNSKSYPMSYSDVMLEIECGHEKTNIILNEEDLTTWEHRKIYVLNIPGNTLVKYKFVGEINEDNCEFIKKHNENATYFLCMNNHTNHKKRILIKGSIVEKIQN